MKFWWHIEWPDEIRQRTLLHLRNNKFILINVLEYAGIIITFVAATHYFLSNPRDTDSQPVARLIADNSASESWIIKACTRSAIGRALGRVQCALMINIPVGLDCDYVCSKDNKVADGLSRIKRASNAASYFSSLKQKYPELAGCRRFHPSSKLISIITEAICQQNLVDPVAKGQQLLNDLGRTTL